MSRPRRMYDGYMVILPKKYFTLGLMTVSAPSPSHRLSSAKRLFAPRRVLWYSSVEGATQLDGVGHVVVDELLGEVEHVTCGELRLAVLVEFPVGAEHVAVAADDLLCLGVPHDELLVAVRAGVELVDVHRLAGAAACLAECYLAQTAYLAHHVRRVVCRNDVYLVVALVSHAELTLGSEFASEQLFADGFYDWFFHCLLFSCFLCFVGGRLGAFKPN